MFVMEQKGYKIIQKNVKMKKTMDSYALCGKITYNKPIGKVSYIDVKKIEEETVSINERNWEYYEYTCWTWKKRIWQFWW